MKNDKFNLFSPKIGLYVMEDERLDGVKIALATEMEYKVKLDIVKLLIRFPHDFATSDDKIIVRQNMLDEYEKWYQQIQQRIGILMNIIHLLIGKLLSFWLSCDELGR